MTRRASPPPPPASARGRTVRGRSAAPADRGRALRARRAPGRGSAPRETGRRHTARRRSASPARRQASAACGGHGSASPGRGDDAAIPPRRSERRTRETPLPAQGRAGPPRERPRGRRPGPDPRADQVSAQTGAPTSGQAASSPRSSCCGRPRAPPAPPTHLHHTRNSEHISRKFSDTRPDNRVPISPIEHAWALSSHSSRLLLCAGRGPWTGRRTGCVGRRRHSGTDRSGHRGAGAAAGSRSVANASSTSSFARDTTGSTGKLGRNGRNLVGSGAEPDGSGAEPEPARGRSVGHGAGDTERR